MLIIFPTICVRKYDGNFQSMHLTNMILEKAFPIQQGKCENRIKENEITKNQYGKHKTIHDSFHFPTITLGS